MIVYWFMIMNEKMHTEPSAKMLLTIDQNVVDENILAALPEGTKVVAKTLHGNANVATCSKLEARLPDDQVKYYFLKEWPRGTDPGKWRMRGEFETAKAIYDVQNSFSPRPITWSNYKSDPHQWFFLCTFHDFDDGMVDPERFCTKLATLHRNSVSPNGKFGFHCHTSRAAEEWCDTWEECFVKMIRNLLEIEWKSRGPDEELARLSTKFVDVVIPRLLRPLETEGRSVKPSLVHGDLWYGNACTDKVDNEPLIFDGKALYAHNEYELGDWYAVRNRFGRNYYRAYQKHMPISAPQEDFRGRNICYSLKYNIHASVSFDDSKKFRSSFMDDMRFLVEKYPGPYPDYPPKY